MPVRGEIHSFGSALARDELVRLLEGSAGADFSSVQLLAEHLEACGRETAFETRPRVPLPPPSDRRIRLSFAARLCELLRRALRGGKGSDDPYRTMRPGS